MTDHVAEARRIAVEECRGHGNHAVTWVCTGCVSRALSALYDQIAALKAEVAKLRKDLRFLNVLRAAGVDSWEGYENACDAIAALDALAAEGGEKKDES